MSDWEASEGEVASKSKIPAPPPKPAAKKKWADEDEDDDKDVASDWEESEEEKPPPKPAAQPHAPPAKKKMSIKQKLEQKAVEKQARLANGDDSDDTEDDLLDPAVKKRLERERELEADMKNATELLQGSSIASSSNDLNDLLTANPKTKEQFADLSRQIIEVIMKRLQNKPLYPAFIEHHIRELAQPLKDVDVRKTASVLTALANEKQKEQREGGKKKKTAKPALAAVKSGKADTKIYEEALDDFGNDPDDFM